MVVVMGFNNFFFFLSFFLLFLGVLGWISKAGKEQEKINTASIWNGVLLLGFDSIRLILMKCVYSYYTYVYG